ncbi:MAG: hypothetical protein JNJ77_13375 [Planctomycetia bacterium]|nr:hypothetical protein [Planctomycetia bacterium]
MLRYFWTFSWCVFIASNCYGQTDGFDKEIELLPKWKVGDKVSYEYVKNVVEKKPPRNPTNVTFQSQVNLEVLEKSKDGGFIVQWKMGNLSVDNAQLANDQYFHKFMNITNSLPIELELDSDGAYSGVRNWKDVQIKLHETVDLTIERLARTEKDKVRLAFIKKQSLATMRTREQVEILATKEPQMFFMLMGFPLSLGESIEYSDVLPNPTGSEPFPSKAVLTLKSVDKKQQLGTVRWKQTIDPEKGAKALKKTLESLAGKTASKDDFPKSVSIEDDADFVIDLKNGWLEKMTHTRTSTIGESSRRETIRFMKTTRK